MKKFLWVFLTIIMAGGLFIAGCSTPASEPATSSNPSPSQPAIAADNYS